MAAFADAHGVIVASNIVAGLMGCSPTPYKRVTHYYLEWLENHTIFHYSPLLVCWFPLDAVLVLDSTMGSTFLTLQGQGLSMGDCSLTGTGTMWA